MLGHLKAIADGGHRAAACSLQPVGYEIADFPLVRTRPAEIQPADSQS